MNDDGAGGVRQQPDGSWVWSARWAGSNERSPETYPDREDAVRALQQVLDDSQNA